jgi:hypothetical protein
VFGIVGEHHHERTFLLTGYLVGKAAGFNLDGVQTVDGTVRTIDIYFALIEMQKASFQLEIPASSSTGGEEEEGEKEEGPPSNSPEGGEYGVKGLGKR